MGTLGRNRTLSAMRYPCLLVVALGFQLHPHGLMSLKLATTGITGRGFLFFVRVCAHARPGGLPPLSPPLPQWCTTMKE